MINESQITQIRELRQQGLTLQAIAVQTRVGTGTVFNHTRDIKGVRRLQNDKVEITSAMIKEAKKLRAKGWSFAEIGEKFGTSGPRIWTALGGRKNKVPKDQAMWLRSKIKQLQNEHYIEFGIKMKASEFKKLIQSL